MPAKLDLLGQRFGRLIVLGDAGHRGKKRIYACLCDCGKTSTAFVSDLTMGKHLSCGCLHRDIITKHGHAPLDYRKRTRAYSAWLNMKQRCLNPKAPRYSDYGGRGITICDRWLSFENFFADMGDSPDDMSLDRINNDGNYEPSNCRWATHSEQRLNQRPRAHESYLPKTPRSRESYLPKGHPCRQ